MKCFYHRADLDGVCAGAIVRKKYPTCVMVGYDYGDPFIFEKLNPKEMHIFVDMSLPLEDMKRLLAEDIKIVWIDHHHSKIQESIDHGYDQMRGLRRNGIGACVLAWEYFFDTPVPTSVKMLGEYDVWNHTNPDTINFHCGINVLDLTVHSRLWVRLFEDVNLNHNISIGKKLLKYIQTETKKLMDLASYRRVWEGHDVVFINSCISESLFYYFIQQDGLVECDFLVSYYRKWDGSYKVSLRSMKDDVDVSKAAGFYGGGGHKGAAGFVCNMLPWGGVMRCEKCWGDDFPCDECSGTQKESLTDKAEQILKMIAKDMEDDATYFNGREFNGKNVAEYFGRQGAAIAALADIMREMCIKRGQESQAEETMK